MLKGATLTNKYALLRLREQTFFRMRLCLAVRFSRLVVALASMAGNAAGLAVGGATLGALAARRSCGCLWPQTKALLPMDQPAAVEEGKTIPITMAPPRRAPPWILPYPALCRAPLLTQSTQPYPSLKDHFFSIIPSIPSLKVINSGRDFTAALRRCRNFMKCKKIYCVIDSLMNINLRV